jgi:thiamine pyrophosphokinase
MCHCERSEAISSGDLDSLLARRDCFAPLAMTCTVYTNDLGLLYFRNLQSKMTHYPLGFSIRWNFFALRTIIFANGQFSDLQHVKDLLCPDDYIIAVNGGTHHALSIRAVPHAIIGDLDSLPPAERARVEAAGVQIISFPARKDETDLELALRHAVDKNATEIVIVAALGGRLDQSFANMFLLTLPELRGLNVRIVEGNQTAFLIHDEACITGKPGDTVSILPIGGAAVGVSNEGLEWPLYEDTLPLGTTRGMSNVLLGEQARISIRKGILLCIVIRT